MALPIVDVQVYDAVAILSSIFMLVPFCYIPASAAVFVVKERASKAQHLQLVSGASACYYWLATYAWDYAMYGLMSGACLLIFVLYDEPGYVGDADQASCTLLLLLLYGAAALPMVYCYSFEP